MAVSPSYFGSNSQGRIVERLRRRGRDDRLDPGQAYGCTQGHELGNLIPIGAPSTARVAQRILYVDGTVATTSIKSPAAAVAAKPRTSKNVRPVSGRLTSRSRISRSGIATAVPLTCPARVAPLRCGRKISSRRLSTVIILTAFRRGCWSARSGGTPCICQLVHAFR